MGVVYRLGSQDTMIEYSEPSHKSDVSHQLPARRFLAIFQVYAVACLVGP